MELLGTAQGFRAALDPEFRSLSGVGLRISAYEVRSTPMLTISARCRRGISPATVADTIGQPVDDLEQIVGTDVSAFVQLTGGSAPGAHAGPRSPDLGHPH